MSNKSILMEMEILSGAYAKFSLGIWIRLKRDRYIVRYFSTTQTIRIKTEGKKHKHRVRVNVPD